MGQKPADMSGKNSIQVGIKVRPLLKKEKDQQPLWRVVNNSIQQVDSQSDPYYFGKKGQMQQCTISNAVACFSFFPLWYRYFLFLCVHFSFWMCIFSCCHVFKNNMPKDFYIKNSMHFDFCVYIIWTYMTHITVLDTS